MTDTHLVQIRVPRPDLDNLDQMAAYLGRTRSDLFRIGAEMLRLRALLRMAERDDLREPGEPEELTERRGQIEELLDGLERVCEPVMRETPVLP